MTRDPNLYFSTPGPFTLNAPQPVNCPLGEIIYAGTKWNSRATYAHAPQPDYMRPTPHYLLVYTIEGEADYVDDTGVKTVLRTGSLMWTRPGVNQSYGPRQGSRWSEMFMWFAGPLFDAWQKEGLPGKQSREFQLLPLDYWTERFLAVVQPEAMSFETPLVRLCRLQQLLADAVQLQEIEKQTSGTSLWCKKACAQLTAGNLTSPSLQEVAAFMNMSYTLFRQRFLKLTGTTPGQYRTAEVMRRACERLVETDEPMYLIAAELGFSDQFHFSRRFKNAVGLSPRDFRDQVAQRKHAKP